MLKNIKFDNEIHKLFSETKITTIGRILKSKRFKYLYDYLTELHPLVKNKGVTEILYWHFNDIKEFPKCSVCGKDVHNFYGYYDGYSKTCSNYCANRSKEKSQHFKETCIKIYGVDHPCKSQIVKDKTKETCRQRYGVNNVFQVKEKQEKFKQTMTEKYGHSYTMQCCQLVFKIKRTCKQKYGNSVPQKCKEIRDKIRVTNIKRYGHPSAFNHDTYLKRMKTCIEKYHVNHPLKNQKVKDKLKKTNILKFGGVAPACNSKILEKIRNTTYKHLGVYFSGQSKRVQDKSKETCLKKYGVEYSFQSENNKKKTKQTCLLRYGCEHISQVPEIQKKQKQTCLLRYGCEYPTAKYNYHGIGFDSQQELAYYIWLTDHKISFEFHNENLWFPYKDFDGSNHRYYPDFLLKENNQIVEIKGSHFFIKPGLMVNPYNHNKSEQKKYECMKQHNVKIILDISLEMKNYMLYVSKKYGCHYLQSFRIDKSSKRKNLSE